jgi:hypothetical protein
MEWTEEIYLLFSELISMPDRELAKRIDLAIFNTDFEPNEERLNAFIKMLNECEHGKEFWEWSYEYLETLPDLFIKTNKRQNPLFKK